MFEQALRQLPAQEQLVMLRRKMAAVPALGHPVARSTIAVPEALAPLLPHGGIPRGSVITRSGSDAVLVGVIASVTAAGGQVAVVGHKSLGLLAAVELGANLDRVALIPDGGVDPLEIASVLLDGLDLVVVECAQAGRSQGVPPSRARVLIARARSKGAVLMLSGSSCAGAELDIQARLIRYFGMGQGRGRLQRSQLAVRVSCRGQVRDGRITLAPNDSGQMVWESATGESARRAIG